MNRLTYISDLNKPFYNAHAPPDIRVFAINNSFNIWRAL